MSYWIDAALQHCYISLTPTLIFVILTLLSVVIRLSSVWWSKHFHSFVQHFMSNVVSLLYVGLLQAVPNDYRMSLHWGCTVIWRTQSISWELGDSYSNIWNDKCLLYCFLDEIYVLFKKLDLPKYQCLINIDTEKILPCHRWLSLWG